MTNLNILSSSYLLYFFVTLLLGVCKGCIFTKWVWFLLMNKRTTPSEILDLPLLTDDSVNILNESHLATPISVCVTCKNVNKKKKKIFANSNPTKVGYFSICFPSFSTFLMSDVA